MTTLGQPFRGATARSPLPYYGPSLRTIQICLKMSCRSVNEFVRSELGGEDAEDATKLVRSRDPLDPTIKQIQTCPNKADLGSI